MAVLGQSANTRVSILGSDVEGVRDNQEIEVLISFENGQIQGNVTAESLTFVRDARQLIKQRIAGGLVGGVGVFEGLPITIDVYNIDSQKGLFEGYIDVSKAQINDVTAEIVAPIVKANGLQSLDARLSAITFGYLDSLSVFNDADYTDIDYVVEKRNNAFETLVSFVLLYLMIKETAESVKDLAKDTATILGIGTSSLTGGIGAAIFAGLSIAVQIAYNIAILSAIINLGKDLINALAPPKRTHKAISYRTALDKVAGYLGYTIDTDISFLDNVYYLPSNSTPDQFDNRGFIKKVGTITKGIPKSNDAGYNCNQFFALVAKLVNGVWSVVDNRLILRNRESDYWQKQASYVMPDILPPPYSFNADELVSNRAFSFSTDLKDEYTINNYTGTSYGVNTAPKVVTIATNNTVQGFEEINFNLALATRKDELSGLDKVLATVAKAIDGVINLFGGNSNLEQSIKNKVGVMRVSDNYHTIPKIIYLEGGRIPSNNRDLLSAKAIYENYYLQSSLANAEFTGQKLIYLGVTIPFSYQDFLKVSENSYFTDNLGRQGKFIKAVWNSSTSRAVVDYEIEQVYTRNLIESYSEQS